MTDMTEKNIWFRFFRATFWLTLSAAASTALIVFACCVVAYGLDYIRTILG